MTAQQAIRVIFYNNRPEEEMIGNLKKSKAEFSFNTKATYENIQSNVTQAKHKERNI